MDYQKKFSQDWTICDNIKIGDVWINPYDNLEYFIFDIVREKIGNFIYFSSFDFEKNHIGFLVSHEGSNYFKLIEDEDEVQIAYEVLKHAISKEYK